MSVVSVIMVSYHTGPVLYSAIASVLMQDGLSELVLVDNGNPPDVLARLQQMALSDARIRVLSGHGNVGFAAGCNLGAKAATGEYLLLLNPDCLLPPDALPLLNRELQRFPNTMLAGGYLLNPDGTEQRGGRRNLLTPATALAEIIGWRGKGEPWRMQGVQTHDVPAISGACMYLRAADYLTLGGMDEQFFLHVEDLDFCMRVAKAGKRIVCVPELRITHLRSTSAHVRPKRLEYLKARGFVYYFQKHAAADNWGFLLPLLKMAIWSRYYLRCMFPQRRKVEVRAARRMVVMAESLTHSASFPSLKGKTVLLIGATSQVGIYLIKHLLASGAAVLAVSRDDALPFYHRNLRWLKQDIAAPTFHLEGYLADMVIHSAPLWHLPKILPLLAACEVKRIVAIGSTSVFTKAASHNAVEREVAAKLARAEQETASFATNHHLTWTILRPTMMYGSGLDYSVTSLAGVIRHLRMLLVYPPAIGRRHPVHAEDVALASLKTIESEQAANKAYNIGGGEVLTYREMLLRIFEVMQQPPRILSTTMLPFVLELLGRLLRKPDLTRSVALRMNEDMVFFHDDAVRDFGYHPRSFLTGGMTDLGE